MKAASRRGFAQAARVEAYVDEDLIQSGRRPPGVDLKSGLLGPDRPMLTPPAAAVCLMSRHRTSTAGAARKTFFDAVGGEDPSSTRRCLPRRQVCAAASALGTPTGRCVPGAPDLPAPPLHTAASALFCGEGLPAPTTTGQADRGSRPAARSRRPALFRSSGAPTVPAPGGGTPQPGAAASTFIPRHDCPPPAAAEV